jgi:hypothetical protein
VVFSLCVTVETCGLLIRGNGSVGAASTAKACESPTAVFFVLLALFQHYVNALQASFRRYAISISDVQQLVDQNGAIGKLAGLVTLLRLMVCIDVMNPGLSCKCRTLWTYQNAFDTGPSAILRGEWYFISSLGGQTEKKSDESNKNNFFWHLYPHHAKVSVLIVGTIAGYKVLPHRSALVLNGFDGANHNYLLRRRTGPLRGLDFNFSGILTLQNASGTNLNCACRVFSDIRVTVLPYVRVREKVSS